MDSKPLSWDTYLKLKPFLLSVGLVWGALEAVGGTLAHAALPFPHLKVFEHYAVYWPGALSLKPRFLPSIQNGTMLTGSFQGSEVSAWLSQGALRKSISFTQVESEWTDALSSQRQFEGIENRSLGCKTLARGWFQCSAIGKALTAQKVGALHYVAQALFVDSGRARILIQTRSPASESHALAFLEQLKLKRTLPPEKKKKKETRVPEVRSS